jgi:Sec-independent protein translocase protein TatA
MPLCVGILYFIYVSGVEINIIIIIIIIIFDGSNKRLPQKTCSGALFIGFC